MNRPLKFRVLAAYKNKEWSYWNLTDKYAVEELEKMADWDTVGQFTGLLDKNGKEVYEGDIFRLPATFVVEFDNGYFGLREPGSNYILLLLAEFYTDKIEVIGNIHEHPHLLDNDPLIVVE